MKNHTEDGRTIIAFIPNTCGDTFWKHVKAGAIKASRESGAEILWMDILPTDGEKRQVKLFKKALAKKADAVVIAPFSPVKIKASVGKASKKSVPTIALDIKPDERGFATFIGTDRLLAGFLAAERIGDLLNGDGEVVMVRYDSSFQPTTACEEGFRATIEEKYPGIHILEDSVFVRSNPDSGYGAVSSLFERYNETDAVFASNEKSTEICLNVIKEKGLVYSLILVGCDFSKDIVYSLEKGEIQGLVLQNPFTIGSLSVQAALASIRGEKVARRLDTGVVLATPENMIQPEISSILYQDTAAYLDN